jgi:hypothetical protein
LGRFVEHSLVEEASEVAVESLISGYELVREGQAGHYPPLPEPENRAEAAKERSI